MYIRTLQNMVNKSYGIHMMPLVINSLKERHTDTDMHILTLQAKVILKIHPHTGPIIVVPS